MVTVLSDEIVDGTVMSCMTQKVPIIYRADGHAGSSMNVRGGFGNARTAEISIKEYKMRSSQRTWIGLVVTACVAVLLAGQITPAEATTESGGTGVPKINVGGIDKPGGTIKGVVKFTGKRRKQRPLRVDADKHCAALHKDKPLLSEKQVEGKNDTLQNVFVYVSKGLEGKKFDPPEKPAVLDQRGCAYVPHVSGVVVKQALEIRNSDETMHNVNIVTKKNRKSNNAMPGLSKPLTRTFKKAESGVTVKCDVHSWMAAYVHVMDHPFFAVTQEEGTFEIKGLPPGKFEVSFWHEDPAIEADKKTVPVTLEEGKTADVTVTYARKKKKK